MRVHFSHIMEATGSIAIIIAVIFMVAVLYHANFRRSECFKGINSLKNAETYKNYCPFVWAEDLDRPRGMLVLPNSDVIVVEGGKQQITVLWDDDHDGISSKKERKKLASTSGINHGIYLHGDYLYASSATTVFRWRYEGNRSPLGTPQTIVYSIPGGGHSTRTIVLDSQSNLYVQCGSGSNVDKTPVRAAIHRFSAATVEAGAVSGGIAWSDGEVFASGLRNEVGLRFDAKGQLWGVENGVDNLARAPWGNIHNDNPSEELNLFGDPLQVTPGKFYGYPYCFSELSLVGGKGPGTQWAHPDFMNDGIHNDTWCQDETNVVPPAFNFPAHVAPLDILFVNSSELPDVKVGDAFVSFHGSWNRTPPQGFRVVHVTFQDGPKSWKPFLYHTTVTVSGGSHSEQWDERPVGLGIGKCQVEGGARDCLLVTSDKSGNIIAVAPKN